MTKDVNAIKLTELSTLLKIVVTLFLYSLDSRSFITEVVV